MTNHTDRKGMSRAYRARHIFSPYYALLNQLAAGEVDADQHGTPVVEWDGEIEAAAPVLQGFVGVFERIEARRCSIGLQTSALVAHPFCSGLAVMNRTGAHHHG